MDPDRVACARQLVNQVAEKGGLMGMAASIYKDSDEAINFLRECYEQCDANSGTANAWGPELVNEIKRFFEKD